MTVSTNNYQIGQSAVPSQNFTLGTPAVPDGTLKLQRGNPGAPSADVMVVDANGNVAFSGRVTTNRPAFLAVGHNAAVAIQGLTWASEVYDFGNNFNPATGIFKAPISGLYHFNAHVLAQSGLAGEVRVGLYRNGTAVGGSGVISFKGTNQLDTLTLSITTYLDANDDLQVVNLQSPEGLFPNETFFTHFAGNYVG